MASSTRTASGIWKFSYCKATGMLLRLGISTKHEKHERGKTHSQPVTLLIGALSFKKHLLCTSALISAPTPAVIPASWTITRRPVRLTLSVIVSTSQGKIDRRSISSIFAEREELDTTDSNAGGGNDSK